MKISRLSLVLLAGYLLSTAGIVVSDVKEKASQAENLVGYQEYEEDLEEGKITNLTYSLSSEFMQYTISEETEEGEVKTETKSTYYPSYDEFRVELLSEHGIDVRLRSELNSRYDRDMLVMLQMLFGYGMLINLVVSLMTIFTTNAGGKGSGLLGLGPNVDISKDVETRFKDVIGQEGVLEDLRFITELLKNPGKGDHLKTKVPKGILLSGPPGTGKTLLAKAVAGESEVSFIYLNASSLIEMYVGVGAKRVRETFSTAKKLGKCIIFIDEIDAVGGSRQSSGQSNSEQTQTLTALLQELDGFNKEGQIFVIAATNTPETLDKALTRAGRFDRQVEVLPPRDAKVRETMLSHYLKGTPMDETVDLERLSKQIVGFTGADIEAYVNEAKLIGTMKNAMFLNIDHFNEAMEKVVFKGTRVRNESDKSGDLELVAYHEAGHAVASYLLGNPIARATVIGNTSGVGGAVFHEEKLSKFTTKSEMEENIIVCYAGTVAEELFYGERSVGASSDIKQATQTLKQMVGVYGMSLELGVINLEMYGSQGANLILEETRQLSKGYYERTREMLSVNKEAIEVLAEELLEKETLEGQEVGDLLSGIVDRSKVE